MAKEQEILAKLEQILKRQADLKDGQAYLMLEVERLARWQRSIAENIEFQEEMDQVCNWRDKAATQDQLKYLRILGYQGSYDLTKGEACDMIQALKAKRDYAKPIIPTPHKSTNPPNRWVEYDEEPIRITPYNLPPDPVSQQVNKPKFAKEPIEPPPDEL